MACEHRHVVEYSEGSIDQADILLVFRDIARLGNLSDHPSPLMEIVGHERGVDFPVGCPLLLSSLRHYGYQRYADSQRRNSNGYEVLPGLDPTHGNTILLQSAKQGQGGNQLANPAAALAGHLTGARILAIGRRSRLREKPTAK